MKIPAATAEMVFRYFGVGSSPDYSATLGIISRRPYENVEEILAARWALTDLTDYNYDLGFVYALTDHQDLPTVRLSVVGPYAVIIDPQGRVVDTVDVAAILNSEGFEVMNKEVLELPVDIWKPEVGGCLYEFLFEFDQGLPWDR